MQKQLRVQALGDNYFIEDYPSKTNRRQVPGWTALARKLSVDFGVTQASLDRLKVELDNNTVAVLDIAS
jgi:hypothetical protein